jgi:putative oxidoreductase
MDAGLLMLRIVVGLLLVAHGTNKLFGWFGGGGMAGSTRFFRSIGYWPPRAMARAAAGTEVLGGAALIAGLATPLVAAAVIGLMLNVVAVHRHNGLWAVDNGYEYPLTLATVAAALGFTGAGAVSVDAWLGLGGGGITRGLFAVGLGLLIGSAILISRIAALAEGGPAAAIGNPAVEKTAVEKTAA